MLDPSTGSTLVSKILQPKSYEKAVEAGKSTYNWAATFAKNVDWKKVATGVAVAAGVTLLVVVTGGAAAPVIAGAAIGAGSGAVISGGITAAQGGSIEDVAKAASDGFMWGAIGGSVSGGASSVLKSAATSGSKAATSVAVGKVDDAVRATSENADLNLGGNTTSNMNNLVTYRRVDVSLQEH